MVAHSIDTGSNPPSPENEPTAAVKLPVGVVAAVVVGFGVEVVTEAVVDVVAEEVAVVDVFTVVVEVIRAEDVVVVATVAVVLDVVTGFLVEVVLEVVGDALEQPEIARAKANARPIVTLAAEEYLKSGSLLRLFPWFDSCHPD
jgi:hypothetical protein